MSPDGHTPAQKGVSADNIYTAMLALAFAVVVATVAFVACKCYFQYGTFFKIP